MTEVNEEISKPLSIMNPLVLDKKGFHNVLVNFETINPLIGRLMEMCELNGDVEQRNALKRQIKQIVNDWLRNEYSAAGSGVYGRLEDDVEIFEIQPLSKEKIEDIKKNNL